MSHYKLLEFEELITYAGQDMEFDLAVVDADGDPVDITGWEFGAWAQDQADGEIVLSATDTDFEKTSLVGGLAKMRKSRAETLDLGGKTLTLTFWRFDTGNNDDLAEGNWIVLETARPTS